MSYPVIRKNMSENSSKYIVKDGKVVLPAESKNFISVNKANTYNGNQNHNARLVKYFRINEIQQSKPETIGFSYKHLKFSKAIICGTVTAKYHRKQTYIIEVQDKSGIIKCLFPKELVRSNNSSTSILRPSSKELQDVLKVNPENPCFERYKNYFQEMPSVNLINRKNKTFSLMYEEIYVGDIVKIFGSVIAIKSKKKLHIISIGTQNVEEYAEFRKSLQNIYLKEYKI